MRLLKVFVLALAAGGWSTATARADVKPHPLFTDNMVLQQGVELTVWGKADPGEKVTVELARPATAGAPITAEATADKDGMWKVTLPKQPAGTGLGLTIKGKNTVALRNVAVGEVWVCSGQSNMQWSVNQGEDPEKVKAGAKNPNLRLFTVQRRPAATPQYDVPVTKTEGFWTECTPELVANFSAVAYHFGQKLHKELNVPVGLIHSSWGGTVCQAWCSKEALAAVPELKYYVDDAAKAISAYEQQVKNYDPKKAQAAYETALAKWKEAAAKAKADGKPVPKGPTRPGQTPPPLNQNTPTVLYNGMIHPIQAFAVKGAIWYQGESNAGKAYEYRTLYPTMIQDWRKRFGTELPFFGVQLAPFRGGASGVDYAELRDAQLLATKKLPKVGIAVITDHGNETNIHPTPKQPVGERLALDALAIAYNKPVEYSGPAFKSMAVEGDHAVLTFDHVGGGLVAKGGELTGFAVAGADNKFHPAKAEIRGDTVVVSSPEVTKPVAVRYGWVNFAKPTLNFFNKAGLPASPFRTDDLPLTTQPKK